MAWRVGPGTQVHCWLGSQRARQARPKFGGGLTFWFLVDFHLRAAFFVFCWGSGPRHGKFRFPCAFGMAAPHGDSDRRGYPLRHIRG